MKIYHLYNIKKNQKGFSIAFLLGSIVILGVIGYLGSTIFSSVIGGNQRISLNTQSSQALVQAAYTLTTEVAYNASGIPVANTPNSTGVYPNGGGVIPNSSAAPKLDSYGTNIGYCINSSPSSQGDPVFAVVSAGANKTFDTTCSQALLGNFIGDDKVIMKNVSNIMQGVGGTVYYGDPVNNVSDLASITNVKAGQVRMVKADGAFYVNKTGVAGATNWIQAVASGATGGGTSVTGVATEEVGTIIQNLTSGFEKINNKYLPLSGGTYSAAAFPLLAQRSTPALAGLVINTTAVSVPSGTWRSIAYGSGLFVVVGNGNVALTSPDGSNWTSRVMPVSANWSNVVYGNGIFIAIGGTNIAAVSSDGINWTSKTLPVSAAWGHGAYQGGTFLFTTTDNNNISVCTVDGNTWTSNSNYTGSSPYGPFTNVNVFTAEFGFSVVYGTSGVAVSNLCTNTGTVYPNSPSNSQNQAGFDLYTTGNGFQAFSNRSNIFTYTNSSLNFSSSSSTWSNSIAPVSSTWTVFNFGLGIFMAIGNNTTTMVYTTTFNGWAQKTLPVSTAWNAMTCSSTTCVLVGTGANFVKITTSPTSFTLPLFPTYYINTNGSNSFTYYSYVRALP